MLLQGVICRNWHFWSFVNERKKIVFFGLWDDISDGLIFSEEWQIREGRRQGAYKPSREHIRLVEEEGYQLKTFPQQRKDGIYIGFTPVLTERTLQKVGGNWYATSL
jgi:5-methylcytosine-specific restriction protein A